MINPLDEYLAAIDDTDTNYDFSVYGGKVNIVTDMKDTTSNDATNPNTDTLP